MSEVRGDGTGLRGALREAIAASVEPALTQVTWQPLYDTQLLTDGCSSIDFFVDALGMGSPAKTFADTNMVYSGGDLPRHQRFLCVGIELTARAPNLDELLDVGALDLRVRLLTYLTLGPLRHFYFGRSDLSRLSWWRRWLHRLVAWIERLLGVRHPTMYEIVPLLIEGPGAGVLVRISFSAPLKLSAPIRVTLLLNGYLVREAR